MKYQISAIYNQSVSRINLNSTRLEASLLFWSYLQTRSIDSYLAGDFFTAAVPCGGCDRHGSLLYTLDDTLLGHGRNILIAGGPLEGFVISGRRP